MDTYLRLNTSEEQAFQAVIDTMGLEQRKEVMEIVTSWQHRAIERMAMNLLREGIAVEVIVRVTELSMEQVQQQLQAQLAQDN